MRVVSVAHGSFSSGGAATVLDWRCSTLSVLRGWRLGPGVLKARALSNVGASRSEGDRIRSGVFGGNQETKQNGGLDRRDHEVEKISFVRADRCLPATVPIRK